MERVHEMSGPRRSPVRDLVAEHLGAYPAELPTVTEQVPSTDLPNVQLAVEALLEAAPGWKLIGLPAEARHYGGFSLASLLSGRMGPHIDAAPPTYVNVPVAVGEVHACVELGVYLLTYDGTPVVLLVASGMEHAPRPGLSLEVLSPDLSVSERFIKRVRELMHEHAVYRGKVLGVASSEHGGFWITFQQVPDLPREAVILPEADRDAIERHTITIAAHADALRSSGRHLKRGLLLYGPPGTGKTLSVMYLCGQMPDRTTVLLSGIGAGALGQAMAIARSLQPSMVVLEDVDLVAMERTMPGHGTNPLLFQLLNEMDGLAEDADIVFVLTTNRVDLLEPALAARPGRIDQAVEVKLPDADSRRRLLELYLRGVAHDIEAPDGLAAAVARTEGVSAAFVKELVRRAVVAGLTAGEEVLTAERLDDALTDLLEHSAPILRSTLGANPEAAGAVGDREAVQSAVPGISPAGWSRL